MYSNDFGDFPDGLTPRVIDLLIAEAFDSADEQAMPTSALLDGSAAERRRRRIERRAVGAVVRSLPVHSQAANGERRANVVSGPEHLAQGYRLRYAPRWSNDHFPWLDPFSRFRWANDEVTERGAA